MEMLLRGRYELESSPGVRRASSDTPMKMFEELLAVKDYLAKEPMLRWDSIDEVAALDVDMKPGYTITDDTLFAVSGACDQPTFYWRTHHGGFRGIFFASDLLTAAERAALFSFLFVQRENLGFSRIEIKRDTRHPSYVRDGLRCSDVRRGHAGDFTRAAAAVMGGDSDAEQSQIDEWLTDRGLVMGQRLPHDRCPINPSSKGDGDPVVIKAKGIGCYYCDANGPRGFIHFRELIDPSRQGEVNPIKACARGKAHWNHAKRIIESVTGEPITANENGTAEKWAAYLYRALLKVTHIKPDMNEAQKKATLGLIESVFYPAEGLLRADGFWTLLDLRTPRSKSGLEYTLGSLPAALYVDENGKVKKSARQLGAMLGNGSLTNTGYPALHPIRGVDFEWREALEITQELPAKKTAWPYTVHADPPYQPGGMTLQEAEQHIEKNFPGVRLDLLRLLIAGKGIHQLDTSDPPLIMIHGQSEGAKTAHVMLAAELCCDFMTKIKLGRDEERFMQAVADGSHAGAFVFIDEVTKCDNLKDVLMSRVLTVARGQIYHKMFVGQVPLPPMPVIVMADTRYADCFATEVQLSRRIIDVPLGAGVNATGKNWRHTCGGDIRGWRRVAKANRKAADTFTADVIRNYAHFDFHVIAKRLGFQTFLESVGQADAMDKRAFFEAVCDAPDANVKRFPARGTKVIKVDAVLASPLEEAFRTITGNVADPLANSVLQAFDGARWGNILGVPGVELDFQPHHRQIFVRFRIGPKLKPRYVNEEIRTLVPVEVSPIETASSPISPASHPTPPASHLKTGEKQSLTGIIFPTNLAII